MRFFKNVCRFCVALFAVDSLEFGKNSSTPTVVAGSQNKPAPPWTIRIRLLPRQEGLRPLVEMANGYLRQCHGKSVVIRRIKPGQADHAHVSQRLMEGQPGYIWPRMACIQEAISLESGIAIPHPSTVQVMHFEAHEPDDVEKMANDFCRTHQAHQADVQFNPDTKMWAVLITYDVA